MVEPAIAWLLPEPAAASVIAGATSAEQVAQNAAAVGKQLSALDRMELDRRLGRSAAVANQLIQDRRSFPQGTSTASGRRQAAQEVPIRVPVFHLEISVVRIASTCVPKQHTPEFN